MNNEKAIEVLNSLVEINNDRIEGYKSASEETDSNDLKGLFMQFKNTSERCITELTKEIIKCGGIPEEGTKTSGKLYRAYMDLKAALTGNDQQKILDSCEYGEDKAVETYKDVFNNNSENLTAEQISLVRSQYDLIKNDHDTVKSMRDSEVTL
ncbi:MAG TPA: PA2169 family four-helix-bundle protein [Ignavibacteria bacterium]|nr:PA2169 family four-helix-bundle protein [Ignavibacteria bacterium]HRA98794.1 PA2169 family four-helix-bundle protein [Ignavibacteria bacterium]